MEYHLNELLINVCQWTHRVEGDTTGFLFFEVNIWLLLVQSDAHSFELILEKFPLHFALCSIEHDNDQVSSSRHSNYLSTTAFALRSTFDDTGQIEQLNIGPFVLDDARNTGQCGELVRGTFTLCVCDGA